MRKILITGATGFIGSHTSLLLLKAGYNLLLIDNLSNSSSNVIDKIANLAGIKENEKNKRLNFFKGDIRDTEFLERIFRSSSKKEPIDAVIHFAALKSVAESLKNPLNYWDVNVSGTRKLLEVMEKNSCRSIVFSSSATIYGNPLKVPIEENALIQPINPYGKTKAAVEMLLADIANCQNQKVPIAESNTNWRIARLRYFNPVGAHPSGIIGEEPKGTPNNLFPILGQVAAGKKNKLYVFGDDWPTIDGSGVRDYIHVMDLAEGHLSALEKIISSNPQLLTLNLGSGSGHSVFEVISCFEEISGQKIPYEVIRRRSGDSPISIANPTQANNILGWETKRTLKDICIDGWNWQSSNPKVYL
tara:strand:+ start:276 stop:1355 length:1080 start_codon:yes stop_codon:yes gene_type:complete